MNLMQKLEMKKREFEDQLEKIKGDRSGLLDENGKKIKQNLAEIKDYLNRGIEDLSNDEVDKIKRWFSG